ncbi:MAG TPA: hypothetical protein VEW92_06485 [Nitrososphaeraceae archaeon]|nr:hypothetical protein [Nitrososphaeraceae archaeon]
MKDILTLYKLLVILDNTQSSSLSQQSNNQVMQSQPNILKDIISDRTE